MRCPKCSDEINLLYFMGLNRSGWRCPNCDVALRADPVAQTWGRRISLAFLPLSVLAGFGWGREWFLGLIASLGMSGMGFLIGQAVAHRKGRLELAEGPKPESEAG